MNTIIIDDEKDARTTLQQFLQLHCPQVQVRATADGVANGLKVLQENDDVDLVFLDIRMNDGTGFDLLQKLPEVPFQLIFTTAHDEYAVKAFRYGAVDYLLKPIDPTELQAAVERIAPASKPANRQKQVHGMMEMYRENKFDRIAIPSVDEFLFVSIADIVRCEADSNYTYIFLNTGKKIVAPRTLKEFEEILASEGFFRVHQSHLISLKYIQQFNKVDNLIKMSDGSTVEVSRRKKTLFLDFINMRKL